MRTARSDSSGAAIAPTLDMARCLRELGLLHEEDGVVAAQQIRPALVSPRADIRFDPGVLLTVPRQQLPLCEDDLDTGDLLDRPPTDVGRLGMFAAIHTERTHEDSDRTMPALREFIGELLNARGDDAWGYADGLDWYESEA